MKVLISILLAATTIFVSACGDSDADKKNQQLMRFEKMPMPTLGPLPAATSHDQPASAAKKAANEQHK